MFATFNGAPPSTCQSGIGGHPLELIPLFRRWPRSIIRDLLYTVIWNSLFALAFTLMALLFDPHFDLREMLRVNMVFAQSIGFSIQALFVAGDRLLRGIHRRTKVVRTFYYTMLPIAGVFIGYWVGSQLLGFSQFQRWLFTARGFTAVSALSLIISGILLMIFIPRERAAHAEAEAARQQAKATAAEKDSATARLKLLEAQIEPHFLYNTLANAISLVDTRPDLAKRMLERLIELLRAAAAVSEVDGTLEEQLRWLRAYLDIFSVRMGARLDWHIDVPIDLLSLRVSGMLLQPLVENAVKHGLEPKVEGGKLEITARRERDAVRLTVRDTGLGFRATGRDAPSGIGLANLRARLAARYGERAEVIIEDNVPSGASVSLLVPTT
ncbi:MAG: histidine kinase [Pseudomonadota bacterium]|nr:histidine kinase [Pseudomonadota bacterium]